MYLTRNLANSVIIDLENVSSCKKQSSRREKHIENITDTTNVICKNLMKLLEDFRNIFLLKNVCIGSHVGFIENIQTAPDPIFVLLEYSEKNAWWVLNALLICIWFLLFFVVAKLLNLWYVKMIWFCSGVNFQIFNDFWVKTFSDMFIYIEGFLAILCLNILLSPLVHY